MIRELPVNDIAERIYKNIKDLPIVDYHCHLSAKEIYEDKQFENIGEMWLGADHYKWRLMRTAGVDERYITGDADWREKFIKYVSVLEYAAGNPLYGWSHMELSRFFDISTNITAENAEEIYSEANRYIERNSLSPRKIIEKSRVEVICTTDDIIDSLDYHKKLEEDITFKTKICPSFRTDNLMLVKADGYKMYINRLSETSGIRIDDLKSLKSAVSRRLDYFCENGCKFADVGIEHFPDRIANDEEADAFFKSVLEDKPVSFEEYMGFIGNMYLFLASEYKKRKIVMQLHLSVLRNVNSNMYKLKGTDCGCDCVGDAIKAESLTALLDAINRSCGMPKMIIYTLNPSNAEQIASVAGAFVNIQCGAAWWFCDHKRGIRKEINVIAENSSLGNFLGMLTDSRSFLSYVRHDYFRRILSNVLGEWVERGEYDETSSIKLAEKVSYYNAREVFGK